MIILFFCRAGWNNWTIMQVMIRKCYHIKLVIPLSKHFCNTLEWIPCSARVEWIPCSSLAACVAFALPTKLSLSQALSFLTSAFPILSSILAGGEGMSSCVGLSCGWGLTRPRGRFWGQVEMWWDRSPQPCCQAGLQQALSGGTVPGCQQGWRFPCFLELQGITMGLSGQCWAARPLPTPSAKEQGRLGWSLGSPSPWYLARSQWQDSLRSPWKVCHCDRRHS